MLFFHIGSRNPQKLTAVMQAFMGAANLLKTDFLTHEVVTHVSEQPKSLHETLMGARERAIGAVEPYRWQSDVHLGVGLESGLVTPVPHRDIVFTMTCCAIYNPSHISHPVPGEVITEWTYGFSSGFTIPDRILQHVKAGLDLSQATRAAGYTTHPKIGEGDGLIGLLSGGRITRCMQLQEAVRNALFHLDQLL